MVNIALTDYERKNIGDNIKEAREKNIDIAKQEVLAQIIGCDKKTISRAENGGQVSVITLNKIADCLGIFLEELNKEYVQVFSCKNLEEIFIGENEVKLESEIKELMETHESFKVKINKENKIADYKCDGLTIEDYELISELIEYLENMKCTYKTVSEKIKNELKIKKLCNCIQENGIKIFIEEIKDYHCYVVDEKKPVNEYDYLKLIELGELYHINKEYNSSKETREDLEKKKQEFLNSVETEIVHQVKFCKSDKKIFHFYKSNSSKIKKNSSYEYIVLPNKNYLKLEKTFLSVCEDLLYSDNKFESMLPIERVLEQGEPLDIDIPLKNIYSKFDKQIKFKNTKKIAKEIIFGKDELERKLTVEI